jgi:hypothetical protein
MKTLKQILVLLLLVGAVAGAVLVWRHAQAQKPSESNPYAYDVDKFKKTDPALIRYEEVQQIKLGITNLHAIAVDADDKILVTADNMIVFIGKDGKSLSKVNTEGSNTCAAIDRAGDVYLGVTDHVEIFDKAGTRKAKWEKPDENVFLTSLAVFSNEVFAADFANRIVWRYSKEGKLIGRIGDRDEAKGILGFIVPSPYFDLAVAPDATVWIVSPGRQRVEHYTSEGKFLGCWGGPSMEIEGFCGCCNPSHIALMADGAFVTSEKGLPRVKVYEPDGRFRCVVAAPEHFIEDTVGMDLAVDSAGRILVLDPMAQSVRIFALKKQKN